MKTGTIKRFAMSAMTVALCATMVAQEGKDERRAQIESKKVAYCTERADLTETESIKFWALHNELQDKKRALRKDAPSRKDMDIENMSDAEIEKAIRLRKEQHIKADQLELAYLDKFLQVVSAKKYALIERAEKEFKREVLKDMRDRPRQGEHRDGIQRGAPEKN